MTGEEREQLLRWSRRATSAQALALRSKIILGCADGADNVSVAGALGCSSATVGKWRRRFVAERLDEDAAGEIADLLNTLEFLRGGVTMH